MTEPASPDLADSGRTGAAERIMTLAGPVLSGIVGKLIEQNPVAVADFSRLFPPGDVAGQQSIAEGLGQQHQQIAALMQETGEQLGTAAADVTSLDWVTPEQQAQLDGAGRDGDWRQWLPGELDRRVPGWSLLTPGALAGTLDGLVGLLSLPFEPEVTEIMENVMQPALQELYAQIPDMADELGMKPDELREYIDSLPDDFFSDLVEKKLEV